VDDLEKTIALMGVSESVTIGQPTLGLVHAALVEVAELRARLAAQQPVIDAAGAWQQKRLNLGYPPPWTTSGHDGSTSIPEARVLYDAVVDYGRAALSGSVEAPQEENR
jgi:hypothetical protein